MPKVKSNTGSKKHLMAALEDLKPPSLPKTLLKDSKKIRKSSNARASTKVDSDAVVEIKRAPKMKKVKKVKNSRVKKFFDEQAGEGEESEDDNTKINLKGK